MLKFYLDVRNPRTTGSKQFGDKRCANTLPADRFSASSESQYPCCLDGAEWVCPRHARGQDQSAYTSAVDSEASTSTELRLSEVSRPRTLIPKNEDVVQSTGAPSQSAGRMTSESVQGRAFSNLTDVLVRGTWIARDRGDGNTSEADECALYLELDDRTGDITAVPTSWSDEGQVESTNQSQSRCGITMAVGKQQGGGASSLVVFAFIPETEAEVKESSGVLLRRGRFELLRWTIRDEETSGGGRYQSSSAGDAALAIIWEPGLRDDEEDEGKGGAFSQAWVKTSN